MPTSSHEISSKRTHIKSQRIDCSMASDTYFFWCRVLTEFVAFLLPLLILLSVWNYIRHIHTDTQTLYTSFLYSLNQIT